MPRTWIPENSDYVYDQPRHAGKKGVLLQRTRTVKAGEYLDADIYPVLSWPYAREAKQRRKTPEQMRKANFAHAFRYAVQLLNANFGEGDLKCDLTCAHECTYRDFLRVKRNFMDRLRARFRAAGVPMAYFGIMESTNGGKRHHIHMVLRGGVLTRNEVEDLWGQGTANADRVQVQYQEKGLEGFARYITQHKDTQEKLMRRKWFASKGLKKPRPTYSDRRFSRAAAARIEKAVREDAAREFEKRYPGYMLIDYQVHYSDFLPGVYIHAFMRRAQAAHKKKAGDDGA